MLGSAQAIKLASRELENLAAVLRLVPGRTAVVQAGGNLGIFAKRLASEFETTYVFEPAPELFQMMQVNAPEHNIVRFQAALGSQRGLVGVCRQRRDGKSNNHEGITHVVPNGTIPTLRVDDLGLPVLDLLYLDIEGCELDAMRGATETLARCRPVVALEINKNLKYVGVTEDEVHGFVTAQGYRYGFSVGSDRVFFPCH